VYHRPDVEIDKERHYFSHFAIEPFDLRDADEYQKWFPRTQGNITGEWTPDYAYFSWVPEMLKASAPDAKLLVLLRDPVERFVSGARHLSRMNEGALPDGDIFQEVFARGLYGSQLRRWLEHFPRSQLHVLIYEDCVETPNKELNGTFEFLELEPWNCKDAHTRIVNPSLGDRIQVLPIVKDRIRELYREDVALLSTLLPEVDLTRWVGFG
jgi:hypothetical protein